jgi:hypothetical protein
MCVVAYYGLNGIFGFEAVREIGYVCCFQSGIWTLKNPPWLGD